MAVFAFLLAASPAAAQSWLDRIFQPFGSRPPTIYAPPENRRPAPRPAAPRPKPKPIADKPIERPAVATSYVVAVLGDSLGQMLGQGLTEAFSDHPEVAVLRKARESTGLVRDDFYDWTKATRDLLASGEKIDFAVMMIGSNDRQAVRDSAGVYEPLSAKWLEIYKARIDTIATLFRDKKVPLIWVGMPIMKSERLADDMLAFNDAYREQASKDGATYIDIWEAFSDERGQYKPFGPDVDGLTTRLRAADGVHFTRAGARKLAHFIEGDIRRDIEHASVPTANAASPVAEPARAIATPASAPTPIAKPLAGPVLQLTGAVLAPDGRLATHENRPAALSDPAGTLIENTLANGQPLQATPGRADDFAWPKR